MTEEEKAALAAKEGEASKGETVEVDQLALRDEKISKLEEERDNYKAVALKRLGKLPGDAEFLGGDDGKEMSVAEQIRIALLDKEIESEKKAKDEETKRLVRENSELKLALKNRPNQSKDNVFSAAQLEDLRQRAIRLKADPEKFIENAKKNLAKLK
jgi:hypothetical protein